MGICLQGSDLLGSATPFLSLSFLFWNGNVFLCFFPIVFWKQATWLVWFTAGLPEDESHL
jgi:hypothetical protein